MFCPNCGAKNADNIKYCESCGCVLNRDNQNKSENFQEYYEDSLTVTAPSLTPESNGHYNPQSNMKWEPVPSYINIPQPPEPPKKSKTGLVVGIIISVVIILAAVFTALVISGTIEINLFNKETTTHKSKNTDSQQESESTSEEASEDVTEEDTTEEETTEPDTSKAAKKNLVGKWNVVLLSSEVVYGNSNEAMMPFIIEFGSDGTYEMSLDEDAYEIMIRSMFNAVLEEEGYFEMDDAKKAEYLTTEFGVETEEELYELFYEIYLDEHPITEWEGVLSSMPMQKKGYWAVNGDYLYFADTESQRDAFLNNPKSYKYDTIKTSLTRGPNNFAIADGEDSFVFVKQ